jgi:predicted porin
MNKKLIVAAVAGTLLAPAFALAQATSSSPIPTPAQERARETAISSQTNVVVYGIINGALQFDKDTGATSTADTTPANNLNTLIKAPGPNPVNQGTRQRIQSYSSRIGFRGSEDLGNGLKAVFQIENQVNTDGTSGGSLLGSREVKVGLAGAWGEINYGQWLTPYALASIYEDDSILSMGSIHNILGSTGFGIGPAGLGSVSAFLPGAYVGRLPNSVIYQSPTMMGFDVRLQYMADETKTASNAAVQSDPRIWSGSIAYNGRGWRISYSYQNAKDQIDLGVAQTQGTNVGYPTLVNNIALSPAIVGATVNGAHSTDTASKVAVSYTFSDGMLSGLRLGAIYESLKFDATGLGTVGANEFQYKRNAYVLIAGYRVKQHAWLVTYAAAQDGSCSVTGINCSASGMGAHQIAVTYSLALSRRTFLNVVGMKLQNKRAAAYNIYNGTGLAAGPGASPQGMMFQIMHLF